MSTAEAVSTAAASLMVDENNQLREHLKMRQAAMTQLEEVLTRQTERAHAIVAQSQSEQRETEKLLQESTLENRHLKQEVSALQESYQKSRSERDKHMESTVKEVCCIVDEKFKTNPSLAGYFLCSFHDPRPLSAGIGNAA